MYRNVRWLDSFENDFEKENDVTIVKLNGAQYSLNI